MFFENQMEISDKQEIYNSNGLMGFSNFFMRLREYLNDNICIILSKMKN